MIGFVSDCKLGLSALMDTSINCY